MPVVAHKRLATGQKLVQVAIGQQMVAAMRSAALPGRYIAVATTPYKQHAHSPYP